MQRTTKFAAGTRRRGLTSLLVVGVLVAASCGGDDDDASTDTGSDSTTAPADDTTAPAEDTTAPADTTAPSDDTTAPADTTAPSDDTTAPDEVEGKVTDFAAYVGGSGPADDSLEPIKIGYFNQQGGAVEVTHTNIDGVNDAVQYINEEAGGIGGHPLEVVTCYVANAEEEGQQCGQQFANDDSIVAVDLRPDVHRDRVVLRRAGRLEAGDPRRVGQPGRHGAGDGRRALRRRQVHPRAVRDVRPRHAGHDVGGADLSRRRRPGRGC